MPKLRSLLPFVLALSAPLILADEQADREALRAQVERLSETQMLGAMNVRIAAGSVIEEFYANRGFSPAWTDPQRAAELSAAIEAMAAEGLDPADYYADAVRGVYTRISSGIVDPDEKAMTDILLTESLIRVGYHQLFGKVNPYTLDPNWNFRRDLNGLDPATAVQEIIESPSLATRLADLAPRGWMYAGLKAGLARYRDLERAGGWPRVPDGPTLRPGAADDRLAVLARRLTVTGDLVAPDGRGQPAEHTVYDGLLEDAVRHFQERHGLDADGVVGPATLRAMNVPVAERVRQLELSLERARWVTNDLEDDFVLVNIAGFEAYLVRGGKSVWQTRVQVGQLYRQTPIFRDEMKYLVFNPTWTVPYSIATRDILPQVQRDIGYLAERGFTVRDREGNVVAPSGIDWSRLSRGNFPYTLVQGPGPNNALGRVKFMFPNEHAVYLHDTPSQALFARTGRAFSSGCIRVENPFALAQALLGADWPPERIQQVLRSGATTTVLVPKPLPVLLLYWTAEVREDGTVAFYDDVYDRDRALSASLDQPFRIER